MILATVMIMKAIMMKMIMLMITVVLMVIRQGMLKLLCTNT